MNDGLRQDLTQAFARLIPMMLSSIRARGWRSLKDLPKMWRAVQYMRQKEKALAALMAAFDAGTLPPRPPAPEPAPWPDPPELQAACVQTPAPPRPAARPVPVARDRRRLAERPSVPAAAALAPARDQDTDWPWPSRRTPDPIGVLGLPAGLIATGRSS